MGIRVKSEKGNYYLHTLNNTVVATPRGLIAVLENNYNEDGSVTVPEVLRPYMGGTEKIVPKKWDITNKQSFDRQNFEKILDGDEWAKRTKGEWTWL